jgi:hypothetical protein
MANLPQFQESVSNSAPTEARIASVQDTSTPIVDALQSVAGNVSNVATMAQKQSDLVDESAVKQYGIQYDAYERQALHGQNGFFTQQGQNALQAQDSVQQDLQQKKAAIVAMAGNPRQQRMLNDYLSTRQNATFNQMAEYTQGQVKTYADASSNAFIKNNTDGYVTNYLAGNPAAAQPFLDAATVERARLTASQFDNNTSDPGYKQILEQALVKDRTQAHSDVVKGLIDKGDALGAQSYFTAHQGEMDPTTRVTVANTVEAAASQANMAHAWSIVANSGAAAPATGAQALGVGVAATAGPSYGLHGAQVASVISQRALASGLSQDDAHNLVVTGAIESGLNPNAPNNGKSTGLFQFHPDTFNGVAPGKDITNPSDQIDAAITLYKQDKNGLASAGLPVTPTTLYLAHQQGMGGAKALLQSDQSVNAAQALYGAGVYKSLAVAQKAISGNGGSPNATVGQFLSLVQSSVAAKGGATSANGAGLNPTTNSPAQIPDLGTAIKLMQAMAPQDPKSQAEAAAYATSQISQMKQIAAAPQEAAGQQIDKMFGDAAAQGKTLTPSSFPPSLLASLSPEKYRSTMDAVASNGQFAKTDDPTAVAYLHNEMVNDPENFAKEDMTKWIGKITSGTFSSMLGTQDQARRGDGAFADKQQTVKQVMESATDALQAAGLDPRVKANAAPIAQLQTQMVQWSAKYQTENGKAPQPKDIRDHLDGLLLNVTATAPGGLFGSTTQHLHAFQLTGQPSVTYDIPAPAQTAIQNAWNAKGNKGPVPRDRLVQYYVSGRRQGFFQ